MPIFSVTLYTLLLLIPHLLFAQGSTEDAASDTEQQTPLYPIEQSALPTKYQNQPPPAGAGREFRTDFSRATVSFSDILSGGPPKDGIPPIDKPIFISAAEAAEWLAETEPVLLLTHGSSSHMYPLQILTWHEIVNDTVGGLPVAVTYCPLCNTGIAFERTHHDAVLDFGTTGRLRYSNLIMYDRQTESWFQQADGAGIAGFYAGTQLRFVPIQMLPFGDAVRTAPNAQVLSRQTGASRAYGSNPYVGYDSSPAPFLYSGPAPSSEYKPLERVIAVQHKGEETAVAYSVLQKELLVPITLAGEQLYVLWEAGTNSALSAARIADGDDVGSANAFIARTTNGEAVTLQREGNTIVDSSSSQWNAAGRAINGSRKGSQLEQAVGIQHFWFSYSIFAGGL